MTERPALLVLAGTREARLLVDQLAADKCWRVTASLAGVTGAPSELSAETRIGGFGGIDGLADYLETNHIAAVVDATHPFAAQMSAHAAAACGRLGVPLVRLERPAWTAPQDARWINAESVDEAAALLPPEARAFLTVGGNSLAPFRHRHDVWFLVRTLEPQPGTFPFAQGVFAHGMPGEDVAAEADLMERHRITHLVTKNAGGSAFAKVEAAARRRIVTVMIARPSLPQVETVTDIAGAVRWLDQQRRAG